MCGDSIADAEALLAANVGMCMGTGCDVAKDNSDLVILDNDSCQYRDQLSGAEPSTTTFENSSNSK